MTIGHRTQPSPCRRVSLPCDRTCPRAPRWSSSPRPTRSRRTRFPYSSSSDSLSPHSLPVFVFAVVRRRDGRTRRRARLALAALASVFVFAVVRHRDGRRRLVVVVIGLVIAVVRRRDPRTRCLVGLVVVVVVVLVTFVVGRRGSRTVAVWRPDFRRSSSASSSRSYERFRRATR